MAVGLPVIASRDGAVPEIITHRVDGLLAEPGEERSYLAQLHELFGSKGLAENLSQAARQTVQERFSLERVEREFDQLINETT